MGNCLSKGQTSDATPNVPREKPLVQAEPDRKVVTPTKASEESTVEGELNEKQEVVGERDDVASNKSKVKAKEEAEKAHGTTETAKSATTSKEPTLHRLDSGKGLSTRQSERQATPSLDSIVTEKEKVANGEPAAVQTKDKSSVAPPSTEQPSSALAQSTTESEAKAETQPSSDPTPAPTTKTQGEAQPQASAVAEPATATGDEKKSTPIVDFDFGIASDWPLKLEGDDKAADKEETKDSKATPPLTHLITTIPPSTEGEEFKTAVSHPSTASPSVLSPNTALAEAETQQTSAPSSPVPVESSNTKDTPLSITVPKKAESKFNEASDDAEDSKIEATESAIRPSVSRTSSAPKDSSPLSPRSAVSDKSKRQSRISRMFSTANKKQSRKISPNPPSKRMTLSAMPERSPVREKIPEVPALTTITTTESGRPISGTPTSPGATSPGPILEGRKWKDGEDNESLYCL